MVNGSIQYQSITYWILNYKFPQWKFIIFMGGHLNRQEILLTFQSFLD